jgi:hypothetical protein
LPSLLRVVERRNMEPHYPHTHSNEKHQGLHYSGFWTFARQHVHSKQLLTQSDLQKIVDIRAESAKLG